MFYTCQARHQTFIVLLNYKIATQKRYNVSVIVPLHKCCNTMILFCGGGAALANICAINIQLCDASSFNASSFKVFQQMK